MRGGWDRLAARFRALFDKSSLDDDFSEELAFHLEESTSDNIRKGMTPREARRQAHIELGGVEQVRELHRETRGIQWVDNALRDLRFAMRQFLKSPGFSILVILALALGIGTCTTIYSVMQATVLSPLPVREQDRLFVLWENNLERDIDRFSVSIPNFSDYRDQSDTVDGFFAMRGASATVTIGETPERLEAMQVSVGSMNVMGWEPILGREFAPGEDEVGAPRVVMISERFWRSHFETNREILETLVTIDGQAHAIVGVFSDETFILNGKVHLWKPLIEDPRRDTRDNHDLTVCGRLKNGVSLDQAQAEMDTIAESLRKAYPDSNKGWGVALEPLYDMYIPVELRSGMAMLFCAVGVLLLIACANVANLLLSRASTREREIAVRVALGARRVRVVGQLMWESGLYSAFGAVGGVLVAYWGVFLIRVFAPEDLPRAESIALDWRALVFAALACVATVVLSRFVSSVA